MLQAHSICEFKGLSLHPISTNLLPEDFRGQAFDFLGYYFSREPLRLAQVTREKHVLHIIRLYEQLRKKKGTSNEIASNLGLYATRWRRWAVAGLRGMTIELYDGIQNPKESNISQATTETD